LVVLTGQLRATGCRLDLFVGRATIAGSEPDATIQADFE